MQGETKSGFKYNFDNRILTDWRFTNAVTETQTGKDLEKVSGANKMITLMLGVDGYNELMEHIASKNDGFVPAEAVMAELADILESAKETKN